MLKEYKDKKGIENISFEDFSLDYKEGNKYAKETVEKFIKYMAICVNNILNTYNPDVVIINSSFTRNFPDLTKEIENSLNSRLNSVLHVYPSRLKNSGRLLGGASMAIKDFLEINYMQFKYSDIIN